ncbi:MAG: hypothetical protein PWQ59_2072 [Thermoanaerobacterium sp.]|nr:hypothetical protein [Thermoanaerobacterium sp.]MDI3530133.1 hypothetical protein [Thermoanaerobacter sp.]
METIGQRIKHLREKKELTQKQLADLVGITEASLSRYENDLREPKAEILSRIAKALDTTTDFLLGLHISEEYKKKHNISKREIAQYKDFIEHAGAFFMDDEISEDDKEALFRDISELFWKSKEINKQKYKKRKKE